MPSRKTTAPPPLDGIVRLAGLGTAIVGALVLAGLALFLVRDVERRRALVPATGVVVDQRSESYGTRSRVVLTVRFTTGDGRAVDFERRSDPGTTGLPTKGETVTVLYDPADPARAEFEGSRVGEALVGAVGTGLLLVGLAQFGRRVAARRVGRGREEGR